MRTIYKNPKELAICLNDLVDSYLEGLTTYEELQNKIIRIVKPNKDTIYKNGSIGIKISNILGTSRVDIINKILSDKQN